jgi:hypothetical protein
VLACGWLGALIGLQCDFLLGRWLLPRYLGYVGTICSGSAAARRYSGDRQQEGFALACQGPDVHYQGDL